MRHIYCQGTFSNIPQYSTIFIYFLFWTLTTADLDFHILSLSIANSMLWERICESHKSSDYWNIKYPVPCRFNTSTLWYPSVVGTWAQLCSKLVYLGISLDKLPNIKWDIIWLFFLQNFQELKIRPLRVRPIPFFDSPSC